MRVDVVVVGGGPGGSAAAFWAAKAGLDVLLVDKADFPRDKTCGDGLTAAALREAESMGLDVRPHAQIVRRTELVGPYDTRVQVPLIPRQGRDAVMGAVMRRVELDALLVDRAVAAGAKLETAEVTGVERAGPGPLRMTVETGGQRRVVEAEHVVGADGAWSKVRRMFFPGEPPTPPGMHAVRQYVDAPESDSLATYFSAELLPGYGWIFPLPGGGANVGIGVHRDPAVLGEITRERLRSRSGRIATGALGGLFREFLARPDVVERLGCHRPRDRVRAWPIPADPTLSRVATERVLLVGDAARLVDPMTGEGIGQALSSGRIAAESILTGSSPTEVAGTYRDHIDRELGSDLRFALLLLRGLRHRRGVEWSLRAAGRNDWTARNFARWLWEDYPRAVLLTPSRWMEHSLRGTGAYASS